jgi:hypothetical protein
VSSGTAIVGRLAWVAALGSAACGTTADPPLDLCKVALASSSGSIELGHGAGDYTPVVEGETFPVVLGPQGLWMFVMSARVSGMDIADGETAAVWYTALAPSGDAISLDTGCRERGFADAGDGTMQMTDAYFLAVYPEFSGLLAGGMVTLQASVRDVSGHEAMSMATVVSAQQMSRAADLTPQITTLP